MRLWWMGTKLCSFLPSQAAEYRRISLSNYLGMSFSLSSVVIDPVALERTLGDARAGACVTFEGWVRNHNEGREVKQLEYEAYMALAETEGTRVLEEAMQKFNVLRLGCVHRVGTLQIGDLAVWVGVAAA